VRGGAHAAHRGLRAVPDRLRQQGVLGLSSYLASVTMENNAKHLRRRSRRGNRQESDGVPRWLKNCIEERGCAFLRSLSPPMYFASLRCLTCWNAIQLCTLLSEVHFCFCIALLDSALQGCSVQNIFCPDLMHSATHHITYVLQVYHITKDIRLYRFICEPGQY
jgi:hypothetical protein